MDIEEIKKEIIYSDNISRIFEISIELSEGIAQLHSEIVKTKEYPYKTFLKGKISVLNTLQNIIEKRIEDPKSLIRDNNEREELIINRHFRTIAKEVLKKETYDRIVELSKMNYKQFKAQKQELKAIKIE
jgi:hypothetical protein